MKDNVFTDAPLRRVCAALRVAQLPMTYQELVLTTAQSETTVRNAVKRGVGFGWLRVERVPGMTAYYVVLQPNVS